MIRGSAFLLFLFISFSGYAQEFPDNWLGEWVGSLTISNSDSTKNTNIPMQLHLKKHDDVHQWQFKLIYGEGEKADVRDYALKHISGNHYQVDEKNGIILDSYIFDNKLISVFEVQGSVLNIIYTFNSGTIEMEVIPVKLNKIVKTGGNDVPEVKSFLVSTYQKAVLKRL